MKKNLFKAALTLSILTGLFMTFSTEALADGTETTATRTVCSTGSYGTQNCRVVEFEKPNLPAAGLPSLNLVAAGVMALTAVSVVGFKKSLSK